MRFRIATFNLESFGGKRDHAPLPARVAALAPLLRRLDADLFCLQELDGWEAAPHRYELRGLAALAEAAELGGFDRASSEIRPGHGPGDRHNLALLSRLKIGAARSLHHQLVPPPLLPGGGEARFDRPILQAEIALPGGAKLHVLNLHLRAPVAASSGAAAKRQGVWATSGEWARGYALAAQKRIAQALEARLAVEAIFDAEPQALILVAGDLNADLIEMPTRLLLAEIDDSGNPALAKRMLEPLERRAPEAKRFTVLHGGRHALLDHLLASPALAARCRGVDILNEALVDEATASAPPLSSFHAPMVGEFDL